MCIEVKAANLILVSISDESMALTEGVGMILPMTCWLTIQILRVLSGLVLRSDKQVLETFILMI